MHFLLIDHEFMGTFGFEILAILRGETAPNEPILFKIGFKPTQKW